MLTQEQITYIMNELGLDPADTAARQTIERIASSKPDVTVDASFIASLREDLQNKAAVMTAPVPNNLSYQPQYKNSNNLIPMFMNKILASALVVMVVLVGGGLWYIQQTDKPLFNVNQPGADNQLLSGEYGVTAVEGESFGDLAKLAIATGNRNQSGGGNSVAAREAANPSLSSAELLANTPTSDAAVTNPATGMGGDAKLIWPGPINYEFKYDGGELPQLAADQSVLKRTKPVQNPTLIDRIISMMSFGLIDMTKFRDVKLQNFTFVEDHEYGYGINVDIQNGFVNVYQNWEKWPQPDTVTCMGMEICPPQPSITIDQLPSDEEAIQIANDFLANFNVSKEGYGTPFVQDSWRIYYERSADKRSYYIPEQVQVVFPLMLEGSTVYDESGFVSGMSVMVDARTRRATSLNELTTKQFERSQYRGETNGKRILEIAERGGYRNYQYIDAGAKKTTLNLDTPTIQMVKIWYSTDNYRTNSELFVPALVFPVKNWESAGYYRPNVVVPLVADILDSDNSQGQPIPLDAPMPVEPDGGNGSSATSGSAAGATEPAVMPSVRE